LFSTEGYLIVSGYLPGGAAEFFDPLMETKAKADGIRVVMVTYQFPPMLAGGARHALELARALKNDAIETFFIGANLTGSPRNETFEGFRVHRFTPRGPGRIRYLTYALQVCRKLSAERSSFDLVHLHSIRPFYFLIVALMKILHKPIVLSPTLIGHDDPMSLRSKPFLWQVEGHLYRYYDRIVCKSTAMRASCEQAGLPPPVVTSITGAIPCATPESPFRPAAGPEEVRDTRHDLRLPADSFLVSFVGRLQPRKGTDLLLAAWDELLKERRFSGHLVLVGPYDSEGSGRFQAVLGSTLSHAAEKRIIFVGPVDYRDVPRYLRASDCFVFPSERESLGKAVIEAMACGVPVICTRIPGVTEDIIDEGVDGIILDKRDPLQLAAAIFKLKQDAALRRTLSLNALDKVRQKFSLADVSWRHVELYRDLLNRRAVSSS
jgi:glycosyltransferase involved in cell wall biosynthesis